MLIFISTSGYGQLSYSSLRTNTLKPAESVQSIDVFVPANQARRTVWDNMFGTGGIGIGQEYWYGVQGSVVMQFRLSKKDYFKRYYGFYPVAAYTSIDLNCMGLFAVWGGVGINGGIALGHFTLDNSLSRWGILGPDGQDFGQTLYNPKIGVHIGRVWIKAGPSILLSEERWKEDQLKLGEMNMNISISYIGDRVL